MDEINDIELKLHRLIRSAMDVMRSALRTEIDPTVQSIVRIYAGNPEKVTKWIDRVDDWAGRAAARSAKRRLTELQRDEQIAKSQGGATCATCCWLTTFTQDRHP